MAIGEKLKSLRLSTRRTLKQQSEIFGVSLNSIYRWEHQLAMPKKSLLRQVADHYGVTYEWLIDEATGEDVFPYIKCAQTEAEEQLLKMWRSLPGNEQHQILGYIERVFLERSV